MEVDEARRKEAANRAESRPLSAREMLAKGRGPYRSKCFAGMLPWHRSLRDVNLANGGTEHRRQNEEDERVEIAMPAWRDHGCTLLL